MHGGNVTRISVSRGLVFRAQPGFRSQDRHQQLVRTGRRGVDLAPRRQRDDHAVDPMPRRCEMADQREPPAARRPRPTQPARHARVDAVGADDVPAGDLALGGLHDRVLPAQLDTARLASVSRIDVGCCARALGQDLVEDQPPDTAPCLAVHEVSLGATGQGYAVADSAERWKCIQRHSQLLQD